MTTKKVIGAQRIPKRRPRSFSHRDSDTIFTRRQVWVLKVWRLFLELGSSQLEREALRRLAHGQDFHETRREFQRLMDEGWVRRDPPASVFVETAEGELRVNPKGFGFVVGKAPPDIFIPARYMGGAIHGDIVAVWVKPGEDGQGPEGRVMEIRERAHSRIVGKLSRVRGRWRVVPTDPRLPTVSVGSARRRQPFKANDLAVAQVIAWPDARGEEARGRVLEVLGTPDSPGLDVRVVMEERGLTSSYPEAVQEEARAVLDKVLPSHLVDREDLTERLVVTIDGADAKDLDDAISVDATPEGIEVGVHIADVSSYVPENSALDREARERGCSVYLVDRVVPMLPPVLSNQICSLNPGVLRLTVSAFITLSPDGRVIKTRLAPTYIKSRRRLTYDEVNDVLGGHPHAQEPLAGWLREAHRVATLLRNQRMDRGAIDFDLPEPKVSLDAEGRPLAILLRTRGPAESLIEEFMLLANEAVANFLLDHQLPGLFRVHDEPSGEKMAAFREMIGVLGYRLPARVEPKSLQALLAKVQGTPEDRVITGALLRSMKQARYTAQNSGHFGLASPRYTHFTSPIRRYPDLFVHRVLKAHITGQMTEQDRQRWAVAAPQVAEWASDRERQAMEAERESVLVKELQFMADKVGETFSGVVSGVLGFGIFVTLENQVEGLIRVEDLPSDQYRLDPVHYTLVGTRTSRRYRLGDTVAVQVVRVDLEARRMDCRLAEEERPKMASQRALGPRRRAAKTH